MIVNLDGSAHQLPDRFDAEEAVEALERSEDCIPLFTDDPHMWITLVQSVHNALYRPGGLDEAFYQDQLVGAYRSVIEAVQDSVTASR